MTWRCGRKSKCTGIATSASITPFTRCPSAPIRGVWICGGTRQVRIYNLGYALVATHERSQKGGERITNLEDLAPEKVPGLIQTRDSVQEEAQNIGPCTLQIVRGLLEHPILDRLPTAGRLVRLAHKHGAASLEAACQKALAFGDPSYRTVKGILKQGPVSAEAPVPVELPPATSFARPSSELVGRLVEVSPWS